MKVLLAYDGSDCANAALFDLLRAGLPAATEVLVATVAERQLNSADTAAEAAGRLSLECPSWKIRGEGLAGSPARALIELADKWQPDLLAAGSHGRNAFGRFLLGSVSHKLVTEARCSVRIARLHELARIQPPKIVLGVDGSEGAAVAVRAVSRRCWPAGTEIIVVAALGPKAGKPEAVEFHETAAMQVAEWEALRKARADEAISSALSILKRPDLVVTPFVGSGSPQRLLVETATARKADAIFLGATGAGAADQDMLGSAANAIVMRATCSVEIVREIRPQG